MPNLLVVFKRVSASTAAFLLLAGLAMPIAAPLPAHAGLVTDRKLTLSSSANGNISTDAAGNAVPEGEGGNGAKAKHTVTFTMATSGATIGSMIIMYCTSPILQDSCDTPIGMDVNLTSVSVEVDGNPPTQPFTLDTTSTNDALNAIADIEDNGQCNFDSGEGATTDRLNCVPMQRASADTESGTPIITIEYGGAAGSYVKNPTNDNYSFYARVIVFSGTSYTGEVDYGGLAASTAEQIDITAKVQEILNFSVGTVATPRTLPACTPLTGESDIILGDSNSVLSTLQAFDNHSYFRINTNTVNGTKVFYSGRTLETDSSDIDPMPVNTVPDPDEGTLSTFGSEQFGLAMDSSKVDPNGGGDDEGHAFTDMTKSAPYHQGDGSIQSSPTAKFAFVTSSTTTPQEIASATGGVACDTGAVRYVANVSTSTPAGIYRTTITYLAVGTY